MSFDFVEPVVFAVLAFGVIGAGAAVVLLDRITASALLMALTFLCMAGMFVLLGAETIAAFQVLIYVGAITVLILFGVQFTKQGGDRSYALFFQKQYPLAAALVAAVAIPVALFAFSFTAPAPPPGGGDIRPLATSIFTDYAFAFEVASVLLLAAMVGAIVLTTRDERAEAARRRK